jgi:hypothetical protein
MMQRPLDPASPSAATLCNGPPQIPAPTHRFTLSRAPIPLLLVDAAQAHLVVAAQRELATTRSQALAEQNEASLGEELVRNGALLDSYRWTQELDELTIAVELPPGTSKRDVFCKVGLRSLTVGARGQPPIVDGPLHARVRSDEALWQLQDSHRLIVTVPKLHEGLREWWPRLLEDEPGIDTNQCVEGEATNFLHTRGERLRIHRVEVPERRASDGEFSPEAAKKAWDDFFTKFPYMSAYELSFDLTRKEFNKDGSEKTFEQHILAQIEKKMGPEISKMDSAKGQQGWERPETTG